MKRVMTTLYIFACVGIFSQYAVAKTAVVPNVVPKKVQGPIKPLVKNRASWEIIGDKSAVLFRGINTWTNAKVTGKFSKIQGDVFYDEKNIANSKLQLVIPVETLTTKKADVKNKRFKQVSNEKLAKHMLSDSFFGLYKKGKGNVINPKGQSVTFTSTLVRPLEGGSEEKQRLKICGTLTIRGNKEPQCFIGSLENTTFNGSSAKQFKGRTVVNRKKFGVGKGWMTFTIANEVNIQIQVLLRKQGAVASQQQPTSLRPSS